MNPCGDWQHTLTEEALELIATAVDLYGVELACVRSVRVWGRSEAETAENLGITEEEVQAHIESARLKSVNHDWPEGAHAYWTDIIECREGPRRHNPSTPLMAGDKYRPGQEGTAQEVQIRGPIVSSHDFVGEWRSAPSPHPLDNPVVVGRGKRR